MKHFRDVVPDEDGHAKRRSLDRGEWERERKIRETERARVRACIDDAYAMGYQDAMRGRFSQLQWVDVPEGSEGDSW